MNHAHAQSDSKVIDSLRSLLPDSEGNDRFEVLFNLFRASMNSDLEAAKVYAFEANQVAIDIQDSLKIVQSYNAIGHIIKEQGYPRLSIPYFEKGLAIAKKNNYINQVKFILNNLGSSHVRGANYAKALEYYLESLQLRELENDTTGISVALNNIGVLYEDLGDYENAMFYYKRNYELFQIKKDLGEYELCLINLADVNNALRQYKESKEYLKQAFDYCNLSQACSNSVLALAHNALGHAYLRTGEYAKAEQEFSLSAKLYTELKLPDRAESYYSLALTRYSQGDYNGALEKLQIAQQLAEELEIPKYRLLNYRLFADIYGKLNDFRKSTEYQKLYITLNDEIYNADLVKNVALVQAEHQEEENLRTIAERDQQIVSRDQILNFQKKQFLFLGVIAALVTVLAMVFYRGEKKQARTSKQLEKMNYQLESAQRTIESQNKELLASNAVLDSHVKERTRELHNSNEAYKKVNDELDNFLYKTSHDIRGPLASLKGLSYLVKYESHESSVRELLDKLDATTDKLYKVLTRLQVVSQMSQAILNPEWIDFPSLVDEVLNQERKRGLPERLTVNIRVDAGIKIQSDKKMLLLILENLIDNAIKFHNPSERINPFIELIISGHERGATIVVRDNGIGIKNKKPDELFRMFVRASERSETGGIGLYLSKMLTERLGGTIDLNITAEEYTEFIVTLPTDLQVVINKNQKADSKLNVTNTI